jgi:hypothetical protein
MPAVVQRIKNRIAESDGVLIVTPEHSATPDPTASRTRSYEAAVKISKTVNSKGTSLAHNDRRCRHRMSPRLIPRIVHSTAPKHPVFTGLSQTRHAAAGRGATH